MLPINIRYDSAGLLGQAALQAGQGQRNDPALGFVLQDVARRREESQAAEENANRLQMAAQMQQQRQQGSPTSQQYFRASNSPLANSLKLQKQLTRSTLMGDADLSPEQQDQFAQLENSDTVKPDDYEKIVRNASAERNKTQAEQLAQQKLAASEKQATERETAKQAATAEQARQRQLQDQVVEQRGEIRSARSNLRTAGSQSEVSVPMAKALGIQPHPAIRNAALEATADAPDMAATKFLSTLDPSSPAYGAFLEYRRSVADYQRMTQQVGQTPTQAPTMEQPVQIKSTADYNMLPSGAHYLDPDGHLRVKS